MNVRRLGSALAVVAFATVVAVAVPSAADAASYPPLVPPVEVLPPTPAEWAALVDNGTLSAEEAALRKLQIQAGGLSAAEKAGLNLNGALSKMGPLARGNTVLLAGSVGFVVGAGGARLVYAVTGTDWDQAMCGLSPVLREGYGFLTMGAGASSCAQPMPSPNADQLETIEISHALGSGRTFGTDSFGRTCIYGSSKAIRWQTTTGDGGPGSGGLPAPGSLSFCNALGWSGANLFSGAPVVRLYIVDAAGNTVASALPTRADPLRQYRITKGSRAGGARSPVGSPVSSRDSEGLPLGALADQLAGAGAQTDVGGFAVEEYDPDAGGWTPVLESPLDTALQQQMEDYPDCYDGSQQCTLTLQAVKGTATNQCLTGSPAACADWWTETIQGTQPTTADGWEYQCKWGLYAVALERCAVYQQAFKPQTGTEPGVITDPGGAPLPGTGTSAPTSPNTINPGAPVGTSDGRCMDTWFDDFNPIDWVMTPVKCALQWAFMPRVEVAAQLQAQMVDAWAPTMVGQLPGIVGQAIQIPDGGTGCLGPHIDIPLSIGSTSAGRYEGYPLSACDEPMSTLASWARVIGAAILVWMTGLGIIRKASAVVNAPGVGGGGVA